MTGSAETGPRQTHYERFDSASGFEAALDRLLQTPGRELRVFGSDLAELRLNSPPRIARLEAFLLESRTHRIFIAMHEPDHLVQHCPRLLDLLRRFSHAMQIHQTIDEIRMLQDSFLVLDANHYLRRPLAGRHRGALGIHDETEALAMRARFAEIWEASLPAVSATTLGL